MNKTLFAGLLLLLAGLPLLQADEKTAVWQRIYQNALNDEMRYEVMLNIRELHDPAFTDLLNVALTDLVSRRIELGATNEVDAKVRLATQIIQELGDLKDATGADQVYQVYKEIKTYPLLRSEAAMTLGKARAVDYVPQLSKALENLNFFPERDGAIAQEIVAYGLVQSLAMMKDLRGFEPTFFASIGWYSPARKVKETAKTMMTVMVEDPSEPLMNIVKTQSNNVFKLRALEAEDDSKASPAQKAKVAEAALEEGVRLIPNTILDSTQLSELRKKALDMLIATRDKTPEYVATYKQAYQTSVLAKETNETLRVLQTMGVNGTPEAVDALIEKMDFFNDRANAPGLMTDFDVQQVRTILQAFKAANSAAARNTLTVGSFLYTPAVQRDIKAVLAGLPK
ncbi:MAG: hypothetical protein WCG80_03315 [Spirochaetales bacterium]